MKIIDKVKDKSQRHIERHATLGYQYLFAESIGFIKHCDWDGIADGNSIFLSRTDLEAIEANSPENTSQRYAVAYSNGEPVVIAACQVAEITGEKLAQAGNGIKGAIARNYKERALVCGNLLSSGLHGVAFAKALDPETGWRIVAEMLYKIRRGEKLSGNVDFVLIKDIKELELEASQIIERDSYRRIQTDPSMVLELGNAISSFDDYIDNLRSKYRAKIKKVITELEQAGFECSKIEINTAVDKELHRLYLEVEKKSSIRSATLPIGYFLGLYNALGDNFSCIAIKRNNLMAGFVTVIMDGNEAVAYYIGVDYQINSDYPIYFRLLQLAIERGIKMGCARVSFGRTALEPKANLGATPVDTFIYARHRVAVVNYIVRQLFKKAPFDTAPERAVTKL